MFRNQKLWIMVASATLLGSLAIMQMLAARSATAQEPNPTPPKPSPTPVGTVDLCCGMMIPGGLTLGGPGTSVAPGTAGVAQFFRSNRLLDICATVQNMAPPGDPFSVGITLTLELTSGELVDFALIPPGEIKTVCSRAQRIKASCSDVTPRNCPFSWRVDATH